jgi:nuclear transcription Y subunit beta
MDSIFPAAGAETNGEGGAQQQAPAMIREQDRLMPIANVIRIMRLVLPAHAKISDDAKETIQECVSEYISFITGEANEQCQRKQRKTITAEDVLSAMSRLGFDDYVEPLSIYLHRYREFEGEARGVVCHAARGGRDHQMLMSRVPATHAHHHDMQVHAALPAHHHGFAAPPYQGHQYVPYPHDTYGGEHAMAAYYGAGAYGPGDGSGGSATQAGGSGTSSEHQYPFTYK